MQDFIVIPQIHCLLLIHICHSLPEETKKMWHSAECTAARPAAPVKCTYFLPSRATRVIKAWGLQKYKISVEQKLTHGFNASPLVVFNVSSALIPEYNS